MIRKFYDRNLVEGGYIDDANPMDNSNKKTTTLVGFPEDTLYGEWKATSHPKVRYRTLTYNCPIDLYGRVTDYEFQVFKKPFWFGIVRPPHWEGVVIVNDYGIGLAFCKSIVDKKKTNG